VWTPEVKKFNGKRRKFHERGEGKKGGGGFGVWKCFGQARNVVHDQVWQRQRRQEKENARRTAANRIHSRKGDNKAGTIVLVPGGGFKREGQRPFSGTCLTPKKKTPISTRELQPQKSRVAKKALAN